MTDAVNSIEPSVLEPSVHEIDETEVTCGELDLMNPPSPCPSWLTDHAIAPPPPDPLPPAAYDDLVKRVEALERELQTVLAWSSRTSASKAQSTQRVKVVSIERMMARRQ
jgi:hypothetical protein